MLFQMVRGVDITDYQTEQLFSNDFLLEVFNIHRLSRWHKAGSYLKMNKGYELGIRYY